MNTFGFSQETFQGYPLYIRDDGRKGRYQDIFIVQLSQKPNTKVSQLSQPMTIADGFRGCASEALTERLRGDMGGKYQNNGLVSSSQEK